MAWRYERAVNLISTQVAGLLGNADVNDDGLTTLAELDDFLRDTCRAVWKSTSASGARRSRTNAP